MKKWLIFFGLLALAGAALLLPVGGGSASEALPPSGQRTVSFSEFSSERPKKPLQQLFIHHSVGGRLMADPGEKKRLAEEIWQSHPEGGGLRSALEKDGYTVHEASYGSAVGDKTDFDDWLPKFRDQMDQLVSISRNDDRGAQNQIVVWKACFPNNMIDDEKQLAQIEDKFRALLPLFAKHPEVLFVHLTTPPLAPMTEKQPAWKWVAKTLMGKPQPEKRLEKAGPLARQLDQWLMTEWLKEYPQKNVVVFDLFDILTDHGKSNYLAFPTGGGTDSHPAREGNQLVTAELVPFLNRAVRRAGLSEP